MRRFILQSNITHFQARLRLETDDATRGTLRTLLRGAQRELALIDAELQGAEQGPGSRSAPTSRGWLTDPAFREEFDRSPVAFALFDPGPRLELVAMNDAYVRLTGVPREAVIGKPLFEAFPDNPENPAADGIANFFASLRTAARTRKPHAMAPQRYDLEAPDGRFAERHWRLVNRPILGPGAVLEYLLTEVEELPDQGPSSPTPR